MRVALWIAAAAAVLYALHLRVLWMESCARIYYRKTRGSSGSLSSAFGEVQALLEPGKRHEVEVRRAEEIEERESGEPPGSGPPRR